MRVALEEAKAARGRGDLPIGAVVVLDGSLLSSTSNRNTTEMSWLSHAEANALWTNSQTLRRAVQTRGSRATLYSTLEPCAMCLAMALFSRIERIVFGASDAKFGACSKDICVRGFDCSEVVSVQSGILASESYSLIHGFVTPFPFPDSMLLPEGLSYVPKAIEVQLPD